MDRPNTFRTPNHAVGAGMPLGGDHRRLSCHKFAVLQECRCLLAIVRVTTRYRLLPSHQEFLGTAAWKLDALLRVHRHWQHAGENLSPDGNNQELPVVSCRCALPVEALSRLVAILHTFPTQVTCQRDLNERLALMDALFAEMNSAMRQRALDKVKGWAFSGADRETGSPVRGAAAL